MYQILRFEVENVPNLERSGFDLLYPKELFYQLLPPLEVPPLSPSSGDPHSRDTFFRSDMLDQIPPNLLSKVRNIIHYDLEDSRVSHRSDDLEFMTLYKRLFIELHVYNIVKQLDWFNCGKPVSDFLVEDVYSYIEKWSRKLFFEYTVSQNKDFWETKEFKVSLRKFIYVMKKSLDPPPTNIKRPTFYKGKWILPVKKPTQPSIDFNLSEIFG